MELAKTQDNTFDLKALTFIQLKTIKDACKAYAKQGSKSSGEIASEIEDMMDKMTL